jgi:hypothetical protein
MFNIEFNFTLTLINTNKQEAPATERTCGLPCRHLRGKVVDNIKMISILLK